jgi:prolyl-tRNA editing enzyme YbaK/EbsC (Cys-tRNA(Pro) deacylase)
MDEMVDPAGLEARVTAAAAAIAASLGAEHRILPCDPALADTAQFCEAYGYSLDDSANTIVVTAKGDPPRHVACVALATTRLDVNGLIRRRLEARKASFAGAGDTVELTGMEIGGVTPFGLPAGLPLWIDAAVMERSSVIVGGGSRSIKLVVTPAMLAAVPNAEVIDGLARPVSS